MSLLDAYNAGKRARIITAAPSPIVAASAPFSGQPQGPANPPPTQYHIDQQAPPPANLALRDGYHNHTFGSWAAPVAGLGFDLCDARAAMRMHRQGLFLGSYLFAVASMSFGPVFAALAQRTAPAQSQPRFVRGGKKGLARIVREEVEGQLAPSAGLWANPCFPHSLWGTMAIIRALMGFVVLQHVTGDPDPVTSIRQVWTRIWPPWATRYDISRRTFIAMTSEREIDITNDGKFTLVADMDEPHLWCAAILALTDSVMSGVQANQARSSYIQLYGNPKPVAIMPPKVPVRGPEGVAFLGAVEDVRNQDGVIVMANGSSLSFAALAAETSSVFVDADENVWKYIAAVLLGSDGTISKTGVYQSPSFAAVSHTIQDRDLKANTRGVNEGHVKTYVYFNYEAGIITAKARGVWQDPVLDIPLPDPAAAARIDALAKNMKALSDQVIADRNAGAIVDQDRVNAIANNLEVEAFILAEADPKGGEIFEYHITEKIVSPDQVLARLNLPPLPNGMGTPEQLAKERAEGKDKTGASPANPADAGRSHERGAGSEPAPASSGEPQGDNGDEPMGGADAEDDEPTGEGVDE